MSMIVTGLIGMALVTLFLGVFVFWVKAAPLIVIILIVLALMAFDFWQEVRGQNTSGYRR
ncbi:MAG: hypothetical protein ACT4N4_17440 [Rhodospirillales bacterium]